MRSILFAAILAAGPALAGERAAQRGDDEVRLFDSPCVHGEVLSRLPADLRPHFRKASVRISGQKWYACYWERDEVVFLVYEDGDQAIIPVANFTDSPGV